MLRFRPGTSILGAFLVAILLFPFWPSWRPGVRAADEPRAFHVEGDVVGAHDPSIIIVYHAYDAKTGVPSLQVSTLTWTAAGHMLRWMAMPRMRNGSRNVFLPHALNRTICCLRTSAETRNCSYKGDRDDKSA
jgi:hypothetical protein